MQRAIGVVWLGLVTLLSGAAVWAEEYRPGDKVVVIENGNLTISGNKVVDTVWPGLVLTVGDTNGEWIWLSNGKPGWLQSKSVIPLDRRAIDRLTTMIKANPTAALYSGRADIWEKLGELDIAIADYNEAIRLAPSASNYNNRGNAWLSKQDYDKAIRDYDEAIRLDPKFKAAHNGRGSAWLSKQENDKAIRDYDEAIRLDPKDAYAYYNRGNVWKSKQDYDKAIRDYDEAIRLDPKFTLAYYNRGNAWSAKQEYDKAIADYREALRIDPKSDHLHFTIGVAHFHTHDSQASDQFQACIDNQGWTGSYAVYAVILGSQSAQLMGNAVGAKKFLDDSAGKLKTEWPYPVVQLLRGELDEPGVLALATDNDKLTGAHCYLGIQQLIASHPEDARTHFHWVRDHGNKGFTEYGIAIAELKRLDQK